MISCASEVHGCVKGFANVRREMILGTADLDLGFADTSADDWILGNSVPPFGPGFFDGLRKFGGDISGGFVVDIYEFLRARLIELELFEDRSDLFKEFGIDGFTFGSSELVFFRTADAPCARLGSGAAAPVGPNRSTLPDHVSPPSPSELPSSSSAGSESVLPS